MTGLTRKEVRQIRSHVAPGRDVYGESISNAPTVILHHWHSDPDFTSADGSARWLNYSDDPESFSVLCKRYAGDIPAGAIRAELRRAGAIEEDDANRLRPLKKYYTPIQFGQSFVRSMMFSLTNLSSTLVHNAQFGRDGDERRLHEEGNLERYVWSSDLSDQDIIEFKHFAEMRVEELLAVLDAWIGEREQRNYARVINNETRSPHRVVGVGVYYFENDRGP